jgi:hypothetical protein
MLIGLAVFSPSGGNAQPIAAGFGICTGRPCYHNIIVGLTRWNEAWSDFPARFRIDDLTIVNKETAIYMDMHASPRDPDRVGNMNFIAQRFETPVAALGSVIGQYGYPCGVRLTMTDQARALRLIYPYAQFDVNLQNGQLRMDSPIVAAQLYDPTQFSVNDFIETCDQHFGFGRESGWRGFAAWDRYWAKGIKTRLLP